MARSGPGTKQKLTYTSTTRTASYRQYSYLSGLKLIVLGGQCSVMSQQGPTYQPPPDNRQFLYRPEDCRFSPLSAA